MSSSKRNRDGSSKKPSVFERLGSKPVEDYCRQWAHKGTCSYQTKCKFVETHKSSSKHKDEKSPNAKKPHTSAKSVSSKRAEGSGRVQEDWEKLLEQEDELALERKLQMLQRELAKQEEQEQHGTSISSKGRAKAKSKRDRSSSSSSTTSSSSSSESSSDSSDSSSSSSDSTSTSSSSSSNSDGEVKERKAAKKKLSQMKKGSYSSSSRNVASKPKAKARKSTKTVQAAKVSKKKEAAAMAKKASRNNSSPKRHASTAKYQRESPTYAPSSSARSRSPRMKESDRDRARTRQPGDTGSETTKRKVPTANAQMRRKIGDEHSPPPTRGRSRERKLSVSATSTSVYKAEKSRDRLAEPGYSMSRSRSPYREHYPARELSPVVPPPPVPYRERSRAEPYDVRRGYSPPDMFPTKTDRKDEFYDARPRRPVSPELVRRPVGSRTKEYHEYDHDWPLTVPPEQSKVLDWPDPPEYRRRPRPTDDGSWNRVPSVGDSPWKKAPYSPPVASGYSEPAHSRMGTWPDPLPSKTRIEEHKRDRDRRSGIVVGDGRRSRDSTRRTIDSVPVTPPSTVAFPETRSPVSQPMTVKSEDAEEVRPSSSVVDLEDAEDFSDFSDDVDEILNRDIQDSASVKVEGDAVLAEAEPDDVENQVESDLKITVDVSVSNENQRSPKIFSPPTSAVESRSTDEDLLGGMDIEQISDEELEDEVKTVDALEVDWTSLMACQREKKAESTSLGARQRWEGKAVLARLGIQSQGGANVKVPSEMKSLLDFSPLFRRALSARMDLALRRHLCNLPVRELLIDHPDEDSSLYKASVDLILKGRTN